MRVSDLLRGQHEALRVSLDACFTPPAGIDLAAFDRFRHRLLWHISIEERLVMPALIRVMGRPPEGRNGLKKDHAGIAALCVPLPEREWVENLRDLLDEHYRVEEASLLPRCDELLSGALEARVVTEMEAHPPLVLSPFRRGPKVRAQVSELLRLVGVTDAR